MNKESPEYKRVREKLGKALTKFEGTAFYPYSSSVVEALSMEILSIKGIAILSDVQSLPNTDRLKAELKEQGGYHTARTMAYERSQQDMLKAGFVKVVKED